MTRHQTAPLLLAVLLSTLALAGCTKITNTDKLDPAKNAASYAQAFADLASQYGERCYGYNNGYTDALYQSYVFQLDELVRASQAGRRGYDKSLAESCLAAIADLKCGANPPPSCGDPGYVMPPAVPPNGACTSGGECKSPAVTCSFGGSSPTCPGKCLVAGGAGAQCYGPTDLPGCATGFWCSGYTGAAAGTCTANVGAGSDCTYASCGTGLYCQSSAGSPPIYTCQYPNYPTSPCGGTPYVQCVSGAYCDATNHCAYYVSAGNSCGSSGPYCESGLYCDPATSVCKAYPTTPSPIGGSCAYVSCDRTVAWCDSTSTCRAYLPKGATCTDYSACGFSSICRGYGGGTTTGTCAALGDAGAPCHTGGSECLQGAYCGAPAGSASGTAGTCKPEPGLGGVCGNVNVNEYANCLTGQCDYGSPAQPTGTCVPYVGPGGSCARLSCDYQQYLECVSGYCQPTTTCHP